MFRRLGPSRSVACTYARKRPGRKKGEKGKEGEGHEGRREEVEKERGGEGRY